MMRTGLLVPWEVVWALIATCCIIGIIQALRFVLRLPFSELNEDYERAVNEHKTTRRQRILRKWFSPKRRFHWQEGSRRKS